MRYDSQPNAQPALAPAASDDQPALAAWGDPITDARLAELRDLTERQRAWAAQPQPDLDSSVFNGVRLTGADVFWLTALALAGSEGDLSASATELRIARDEMRFTDLTALHLDGANLCGAHLERAYLGLAHLNEAMLSRAHLEGADLNMAYLDGAYLDGAHLENANLSEAHLKGAKLGGGHLEGADLNMAYLDGADFIAAHLEHADLTGASFDKSSYLKDAKLNAASLDQATLDNTNLAVVNWETVTVLGDELAAQEAERTDKAGAYHAAARAYRSLAVALRSQGIGDIADRYAFRAQVMQRKERWYQRRFDSYLASGFLALLVGYGYRLRNILIAYVLVVALFTALFWLAGALGGPGANVLRPDQAAQISLNAIHGRVFFAQFGLDTVQSWIATAESVVGIVIEGLFVAVLIQRLFSR